VARINLCVNPSLKNNTTDWYAGAAFTRVTGQTGFPNRTTGYQVSTNGDIAAPQGAVTAGQVYSFQAQIKPNYTGTVQAQINWYANNSYLSSSAEQVFAVTNGTASKVWITATAPAGATSALLNIGDNASTVVATEVLYEQSGTVNGYFDGDTTGATWNGTNGNSASTLTATDVTLTARPSLAQALTGSGSAGSGVTLTARPALARAAPGRGKIQIDVVLSARPSLAQALTGRGSVLAEKAGLPAGGTLDVTMWIVGPAGLIPARHFTSLKLSPIRNELGGIAVSYPVYGENFDRLAAIVEDDVDIEVEVWLQGRAAGALRWILLEAAGDEVAEQAVWTFAGHSLLYYLSEAVVFPNPADPKQETRFAAATAGAVMGYLVGQARGRGTLTNISTSTFSGVKDSRGATWSRATSLTLAPGTNYLQVLKRLVDQGMCEAEVTADHELRLYEPGGLGEDLTL